MLYFENWSNAAQLKIAKIVFSKSIFWVKNQLIFFSFSFHLGDHFLLKEIKTNFNQILCYLKPGPILDGAALRQFTKYRVSHIEMDKVNWLWQVSGLIILCL